MSLRQDIDTHPEYIRKLREVGGQVFTENAKATNVEPSEDAGLFDYDKWQPNKTYEQYDLFMYDGKPGVVRMVLTSSEVYPPFSVGTEALYAARPRQKPDGTYPYVYNMLIKKGMLVESAKDGEVYRCILKGDGQTLLYDPADVPALFEKLNN